MEGYSDELSDIRSQIQVMSREQATMGEQMKSVIKRIDEQKQLAESVQTLALSVRDLTNAQKNTSDAVGTLRHDVDDLKSKPAKRWDNAATVVVTAIITGFITYFITKLGFK